MGASSSFPEQQLAHVKMNRRPLQIGTYFHGFDVAFVSTLGPEASNRWATFPKFPDFPLDIREMIWKHAAVPQAMYMAGLLTEMPPDIQKYKSSPNSSGPWIIPDKRGLLGANRESRRIYLKKHVHVASLPSGPLYVDFDRDVFVIEQGHSQYQHPSRLFPWKTSWDTVDPTLYETALPFANIVSVPMANNISRIALSVLWLLCAPTLSPLGDLKKLKEIIVVLQAADDLGEHDRPYHWKQNDRLAVLRAKTDELRRIREVDPEWKPFIKFVRVDYSMCDESYAVYCSLTRSLDIWDTSSTKHIAPVEDANGIVVGAARAPSLTILTLPRCELWKLRHSTQRLIHAQEQAVVQKNGGPHATLLIPCECLYSGKRRQRHTCKKFASRKLF